MDYKRDNTYLEVSLVILIIIIIMIMVILIVNTHNSNHINVLCFSEDENIKLNEVV